MVPDFQGSHTSEEPPGSDNSHSSNMEGPTLVPCSAEDAIYDYPQQLPCSPRLFQQMSDMNLMNLLPQLTILYGPSLNKFGRNNFSEPAKELLLLLCRRKTSQAYDTNFKK